MTTEITVQGQHTARYPAERATVHLTISFDGSDREDVVTSATRAAQTIADELSALHEPTAGPVVSWSSDRVRVWADRPWNNEGKQLPLVHHAQIGTTAVFSEFESLADLMSTVTLMPGVQLGGIEWDLTKSTRTSALAEVRSRAVSDATDKARVYAQAVGLGRVAAIAIADPGMLGTGSPEPMPRMEMMMARSGKMSDSVGPEFAFTPDKIEVSAAVDARFQAS